MNIKVKKICSAIPNLSYAIEGDAGFDLYTAEKITLLPQVPVTIPTGIALEIPNGYVGLIWDKSGLSIKHGLKTLGGVIDSGYRGEVMVGMINLSDAAYTFESGEKIAQMLIQKVEYVTLEMVDELSDSDRGAYGFGSTGK